MCLVCVNRIYTVLSPPCTYTHTHAHTHAHAHTHTHPQDYDTPPQALWLQLPAV